ncbi:MAG: glycerol-3-phosphate responsive antiterminator [Lachnospiraceae bacterium]|nr:glycerol-3-phosphate responsive antiterminator [Lachnospiraceae bacterium]
MEELKQTFYNNPIIPSATSKEYLNYFVKRTSHIWVCLKMGEICSLGAIISILHKNNRKAMLHFDFIKGIAKDKEGIEYLKRIGVDAIITTKSQHLKMIRDNEIIAILETFLVDSSAIQQTLSNIRTGKPDAVLVMPMTVPKQVFQKITQEHDCVLAGGLGVDHEVIQNALDSGARACIVTDRRLIVESYDCPI